MEVNLPIKKRKNKWLKANNRISNAVASVAYRKRKKLQFIENEQELEMLKITNLVLRSKAIRYELYLYQIKSILHKSVVK